MRITLSQNRILRVLITTCIVLSLIVVSYGPGVHIHRAEAGTGGIVFDPTNLVQNTITATVGKLISSATDSLNWKEIVLDGIAWSMINLTLQQVSKSIVSWINSGFEGSPTFIQDFEGFMTDIADHVAGDLIFGSELQFLCSPFQLNIRLALDLQYRRGRDYAYENQCTLTKVVANVDRFMDGDFFAGGWGGWFQMTNRPANNPYGALLMAQERLSLRINSVQTAETNLANWGKGFLTMKECIPGGPGESADCYNVTPGTAIEAQLNSALDLGNQRLIVADEINEIISALFTQLAYQAFSGGLLRLTQSSGSGSYYDAIANDNNREGFKNPGQANPIETSLQDEQDYYAVIQRLADMLDDAANYKDDEYGETNTCHSGDLPTDLNNQRIFVNGDVALSLTNIFTLQNLLSRFTAASNDPVAQDQILNEYMSIRSTFHTQTDVVDVSLVQINTTQEAINAFIAEVDYACI